MNLEKKEYIPEEYRDVYEDEIDLKELFLVLWRNKIKIAAAAFICMVLGFGAGKIIGAKNKKSTVVVEYNYPGIEEGKSPDGNTLGLTYSQFKNIFMVKDIFNKMPELSQSGLTEDEVLNGIKITPVLPEKLKEGEVYFPNKFNYSLKITGTSEKDEEILKNFIEIQKDYFKRNFSVTSLLPALDYEKSSAYEYNDIIFMLENSLTNISDVLKNIEKEFVAVEDKTEVQTILKDVNILKNINLAKTSNMVDDYRIAKNPDELLLNYRQKIEQLEEEKEKTFGKINQLESMVKSYKPENKNVVLMTNGNSEKLDTNEENYYTEFLRQLAAEKIKLSNIDVQKKYINKKMIEQINNNNNNNNNEKIDEVNKNLKFIADSINENIEKINILTVKNYNRKYSEIIKVTEAVTTKSSSKTILITLAGLILGGFLGVCHVLIGNFIFEEKKKRNNK